jgi:DNA modification methylase
VCTRRSSGAAISTTPTAFQSIETFTLSPSDNRRPIISLGKNDLHPTMKPVALVERAIRNSSKSRDIILDPFGGSGTTMIAAERAGRRTGLIELDPKYVDVIVQRWQQSRGGEARHAETDQPFKASGQIAQPTDRKISRKRAANRNHADTP